MIVDTHTHWGMEWQELSPSDPSGYLAILDKYGIDKIFLMGHANLHRLDWCAENNSLLLDMARVYPEQIIPVVSVFPQAGKGAVDELVRCAEAGAKAVKFHPWLQAFSLGDPDFRKLCGLAGELKLPVIIHDGTPCFSMPEQIAGAARSCPNTTFVLGHSGMLWFWRNALAAARQENIWLCICGNNMRAVEMLVEQAPVERIIWGSDFGFGLTDCIGYQLAVLQNAKIADSIKKQILADNALRLAGLQNTDVKIRKQNSLNKKSAQTGDFQYARKARRPLAVN